MIGRRVIVTGGRDFCDEAYVFAVLDALDARDRIQCVIEGGQRRYEKGKGLVGGVDLFACRWTYRRARWGMRFDAEWDKFGRGAGPIRNRRMLDEGRPDLVVAFPGGRGTADMVSSAQAANIRIIYAVDVIGSSGSAA